MKTPNDYLSMNYRMEDAEAKEVVDVISFCTKNPMPFISYMDMLKEYGQYWFVTITTYGKEIESYVPEKEEVIEAFCELS